MIVAENLGEKWHFYRGKKTNYCFLPYLLLKCLNFIYLKAWYEYSEHPFLFLLSKLLSQFPSIININNLVRKGGKD